METVYGVCGMPTVHVAVTFPYMPTVHAAVTAPAQSGMLLKALTANGNTSLRYAYRTCPSHCPSTVWDAAYGAYG